MAHLRIDRVQNLIKTELAQVIDRELDNPLLPPFITIQGVKVSKDLHYATVLVTFLADTTPEVIKNTVDELNKSAGYIGRLVAQRVQLRRHPQLRFVYNPSTHYALDMEKIFQQIRQDLPPETEDPDNENGGPSSAED